MDNIHPNGALVQLNQVCNYKCKHCSITAPHITQKSISNELDYDNWINLLHNLKQSGIKRIRFTGGEPLLNKDLFKICELARTLGFDISMVTNGIAINSTIVQWIKETEFSSIWISIYAFPREKYELISGIKNSFNRVICNIELLVNNNINVGLYYSVGHTNFEIDDFLDYAIYAGIKEIRFIQVINHGRALETGALRAMNDEELTCFLDNLIRRKNELEGITIKVTLKSGQLSLFRSKGFLVPENVSCKIGLENLWTVDSFGTVSGCCLYLNKGRLDFFNAQNDADSRKWMNYNSESVLQKLNLSQDSMLSCPALNAEEQQTISDPKEFACPVTYCKMI